MLLEGLRQAFPALYQIPVAGEAALLVLMETVLLHRRWLTNQFEKRER